jgi:hypothetical protein
VACVSFEGFEIKKKNRLFCIKEEQDERRLSSGLPAVRLLAKAFGAGR